MSLRLPAVLLSASFACTAPSLGGIISTHEIGSGTHSASIQIDQQDGDGYLFTVHWDAVGYTSWDALIDIDESMTSVSLQYDTFSWGVFLTGITIDGDTDFGVGDQWPIENYWHFWVRDSGAWEQASFGASDRVLFDGAQDAWVFGSGAMPQAVPAPAALALMVGAAGACRGSRRRDRTRASQGR